MGGGRGEDAPRSRVILNPEAGRATSFPDVVERLASIPGGTLFRTEGPRHAAALARLAAREGCERLIVAGGDGTVSEVVDGLDPPIGDLPLGIVPLGTGNDFARSAALPLDPHAALEVCLSGRPERVDVARVTGWKTHVLVNMAIGGFGGRVERYLTADRKRRWGALAYVWAAARELTHLPHHRVEIRLDGGEELQVDAVTVVVANGSRAGGGLPVAPRARVDDGILDLVVLLHASLPRLLSGIVRAFRGKHLESRGFVWRRARKISVSSAPEMWFNADGEHVGRRSAEFEVLPGALPLIVPRS